MAGTDVFGLEEVIAHGLPGFPGSLPALASPSNNSPEESRYLASLLAASLSSARTAATQGWSPPAAASAFESALRRLVRASTPTPADRAAREDVISRLTALAYSGINYHRCLEVQPYGSFVSGLYTPTGDLDLSLEGQAVDPASRHRLHVADMDRQERQAFLRALSGRLQARGARNMLRLTHARVPIIKFVDDLTGIECDCAIDSAGAQFKSTAVGLAAAVDWRVGALVRLVKLWARAHGVNDSATGTFNSFALTMLVFFHLQTRTPALLPPLHDLVVGEGAGIDGDGRPMHGGGKPDMRLLVGMAASCEAWAPRAAANKETLAELLTSFFALMRGLMDVWCGENEAVARVLRRVRVDTWTACLRVEPWDKPDGHYFCSIEDPFDTLDNCGRTVRDRRNAQIIREAAAAATTAAATAADGGSFIGLQALFGSDLAVKAFGGPWDQEDSAAAVPPTPMYLPRSLLGVLTGPLFVTPLPPANHHMHRGISDKISADFELKVDLEGGAWPGVATAVAAAAMTLAEEEAARVAAEEAKRNAQREKKQKKREEKERARAAAKAQRLAAEAQQAQQDGQQEIDAVQALLNELLGASEPVATALPVAPPSIENGDPPMAPAPETAEMQIDASAVAVAVVPPPPGDASSKPRKPRQRKKPRDKVGGGIEAAVASTPAPLPPLPPMPLPPPGLAKPVNYVPVPKGPSLEGQGGAGGPATGKGRGQGRRRGVYRGRGRGRGGDSGRHSAGN